jgi:hypothetical protein
MDFPFCSNVRLAHVGLFPERMGYLYRIKTGTVPPTPFVRRAMRFAVMHAAKRDGELITDFSPEGARLGKAQVMRIRWLTATHQTGLLRNVVEVLLVAFPLCRWKLKNALIDASGAGTSDFFALCLRFF